MTSEELRKMSEMTFDDVVGDEVFPLGKVRHDGRCSVEERVKKMLSSGKNPYFRRTEDGALIKISFTENGRSFEDNLVTLLSEQR